MNKKKTLLVVVAMVLVCALSIMGTLAYMKDNTGAVTNTFMASGGGKLADELELTEHKLVENTNGDGGYTLSTSETTASNSYDVMPGMTLPKDPTITITNKTEPPAYLYLVVCGPLPDGYEWELESFWTPVMNGTEQAKGNNNGLLYVYKDILNTAKTGTDTYGIILNDEIKVADDASMALGAEGTTLTFYAYIAQTTVAVGGINTSDQYTVYDTCF